MSFQVPEWGRVRDHHALGSSILDGNNGAFIIQSPEPGWELFLIGSDVGGWEQVSVHAFKPGKTRTPTWKEMACVKDTCWGPEDEVLQYHPRRSEYVNTHPNVLHLWRPVDAAVPRPPSWMVGPRELQSVSG